MQRLKGIGVSPGVVSGRAVILIQRAHVLRYQIAADRVAHELAGLEESRTQSRAQLVEIRARIAARRPEMSALFDAQLLMLDDPMLVPKAAEELCRKAGKWLTAGRKRAADERSVRQYTSRAAEVNWAAALPKIAPNAGASRKSQASNIKFQVGLRKSETLFWSILRSSPHPSAIVTAVAA